MVSREIILAAAFSAILLFAPWLMHSPAKSSQNSQSRLLLWIAQGFGVGRIPVAPGTFGSILGIGWFAALLAPGKLWVLVTGILTGLALSVWICGVAEKQLHQKDPGSVVLDEITAVPVCFLAVVGFSTSRIGVLPHFSYFVSGYRWLWIVVIFAAFRLFDVVKPWPVRQSQSLPAGWGITVDDVLAAVYVNLLVVLIETGQALLTQH